MFTPASVKTSSVAHAQEKIHSRKMLDVLWKKFRYRQFAEADNIPKQSGLTVQWFRYLPFAANTSTATEGEVGSPISISSEVVSATLSQYRDYMTLSDVAVDTLIDNVVANAAKNLGYRLGLSIDTITRNVLDAVQASTDQAPLSQFLTNRDFLKAVQRKQAVDVEPFPNGNFGSIVSPFVVYDIKNDPSAGGFTDLQKYTSSTAAQRFEDRGFVGTIHGVDVFQSTNVTTITGPPVKYRSYIFGKGAYGTVELSGRGPSNVMDPKRQRVAVRIVRNNGDQIADPEGAVAAAVAYNVLYAAVVLDTTNYRMVTIDAESSITT